MKHLLFSICLISQFVCFSQKKLIATIDGENLVFAIDTVQFKNFLLENIYNESLSKPNFKLSVVKSKTSGEKTVEYYFLLASDKKRKLNLVKWLEKRGSKLYSTDVLRRRNHLQALYFSCEGPDECFPQLVFFDKKMGWSCSEENVCRIDGKCSASKILVY